MPPYRMLRASRYSNFHVHRESLGDLIKTVDSDSVDLDGTRDAALVTRPQMTKLLFICKALEHNGSPASIYVDGSGLGLGWF